MARAHRRDEGGPVVFGGSRPGSRPPGSLEDVAHHEHGHITTYAVALIGDLLHRLDDGASKTRIEDVQLEHVLPSRKVRVPAAGQYPVPGRDKRGGVPAQVFVFSLDEELWVGGNPGVVGGHVIGHEIEDEAHTALGELFTCHGKSLGTSQVFVHDVATHAIRRSDIVRRRKVGEDAAELLDEPLVSQGYFDSRRASFPDTHEPHGIETVGREGIPIILRYCCEVQRLSSRPTQLPQPHPGV